MYAYGVLALPMYTFVNVVYEKGYDKIHPYGLLCIARRLVYNKYTVTSNTHREKCTPQVTTLHTGNTYKRFFVIIASINPWSR